MPSNGASVLGELILIINGVECKDLEEREGLLNKSERMLHEREYL
jgi:hypothetical protein